MTFVTAIVIVVVATAFAMVMMMEEECADEKQYEQNAASNGKP